MFGSLREAADYVRRHLILLPILVLLTLPFTVVHEGAHAVAAWVQGARVTEFAVGPWTSGGKHWGYMRYETPDGASVCGECVSLAPYVGWALVGLATAIVARLLPMRARKRSALFVIGFALPPLDLLQHLPGWLEGRGNDLTHALGTPEWWELGVVGLYGLAVLVAGYFVQKRLHGEHALRPGAYALLASVTALAAPLASGLLVRLLS